MQEIFKKQMLFFNADTKKFFNEFTVVPPYTQTQLLADIVPLINSSKQLERAFLIDFLVRVLKNVSNEDTSLLNDIVYISIDIPTKSALIPLFHKFLPGKMPELVQNPPSVKFVQKQSRILSIPHFENIQQVISAFAGESEIDVLLPLFRQLKRLRENYLSEFVFSTLIQQVKDSCPELQQLSSFDATVYDVISQDLFTWFFEYFPLHSDNYELQEALADCMSVPGSSFDFYELFLERLRDSEDNTVQKILRAWQLAVQKTSGLEQLNCSNITLQNMYVSVCDCLHIEKVNVSITNSQEFTFNKQDLLQLISNAPMAYSSDLFDVISAQILFGGSVQLPFMEILSRYGDGIVEKIDEIVKREIEFDSELTIKQQALKILEIGCKTHYQASLQLIINKVKDFKDPVELLYAQVGMACYRQYAQSNISVATGETEIVGFCKALLHNEAKMNVCDIIYCLQYCGDKDQFREYALSSQQQFIKRYFSYFNVIDYKAPETSKLLEVEVISDQIAAQLQTDLLLNKLFVQPFSDQYIDAMNQNISNLKGNIVQLQASLPNGFLVQQYSDDRFNDEAISAMLPLLGDLSISAQRILAIQHHAECRIKLIFSHQIETQMSLFEQFSIAGLKQQRISDAFMEQFLREFENQTIFAVPDLSVDQAEQLLRISNLQNSLTLLLLLTFDQQLLNNNSLDKLEPQLLDQELINILMKLVGRNKVNCNQLARLCIRGFSEHKNELMCLQLASVLPGQSVEKEIRRKVYQASEQFLESRSREIRQQARKIRICWMGV